MYYLFSFIYSIYLFMFINHGKIFLVFKIKNGLLFFQNPCSSEREKNIYIYILSKFGGTMRENTIVFRFPQKTQATSLYDGGDKLKSFEFPSFRSFRESCPFFACPVEETDATKPRSATIRSAVFLRPIAAITIPLVLSDRRPPPFVPPCH